jgi:glutamate carboxypeptidase
MEFRREGNELHGPGILDMKGGLISAIWTMKAYRDLGIDPGKKLILLINSDEEVGSVESAALIQETAVGCKAALVCEPGDGQGNLKTGRKGICTFHVTVHGKAAHAGNNHHLGVNAIEEMAREIQYIHSLTDYSVGTTLNVGVCSGGTKYNVVPDRAEYDVDCRFKTVSEWKRIEKLILAIKPSVPGASCEIAVGAARPPMEEKEGNFKLFDLAKESGEKLGLSLSHVFVGGGSDGNLLGEMDIPILDGLGATGDGLHASHEHILIDQYLPRIALLASLIIKI